MKTIAGRSNRMVAALAAGVITLMTVAACKDGGVGGPAAVESNDHYMSGTILIAYGWMDGSPVLQEAELLVDGERVGHQTFVPGADRAFFSLESTFRTAGSHRIAIRVIRQSKSSIEYGISGGIAAAKLSDANSIISYRFGPPDWVAMKAGDKYEATIYVP